MENFPLRRFSSTALARSVGYRGRLYGIVVFSKHLRVNVRPLSSDTLSAQLPEQDGRQKYMESSAFGLESARFEFSEAHLDAVAANFS